MVKKKGAREMNPADAHRYENGRDKNLDNSKAASEDFAGGVCSLLLFRYKS